LRSTSCAVQAAKKRLARDDRVSLAIDDDPAQVMDITGQTSWRTLPKLKRP
jgi:hypothetical protein